MSPRPAEAPPQQVVRWLRSPQGERWSQNRIGFSGRITRHGHESGVFAEIIPDRAGRFARTRWPDPFSAWDLGYED
jgi:hypothetical protein